MMKGAIDFLLSDSREARALRKKFVFRIVPMLNPDGVVFGNYRCSLLGVDLNRRWKNPNQYLHPEVFFTKKLFQMFSEDHEVAMYCDMHGHSLKRNVFMYACNYKENGFSLEEKKTNIFIRLIPYLLSKKNSNFSYESCHFRLEKFKESTARIVSFKELNILASYTLEASFYGPEGKGSNGDLHLNISSLEGLGRDLCKQLMIFVSQKEFKYRISELTNYINSPNTSKRKSLSERNPEISKVKEDFSIHQAINEIPEETLEDIVKSEENSDSGGSDAEASDNDEKKICYLLEHLKKTKRKKTEKIKSVHACSNLRNYSNSKLRNISCTPDIINKSRSKSRISVIKNSYNNIVFKPSSKKSAVKSPNGEEHVQNYSYLDLKFKNEQPRRPASGMQIRTSRPQIPSNQNDSTEIQVRPVQKVFERFIALHFKK